MSGSEGKRTVAYLRKHRGMFSILNIYCSFFLFQVQPPHHSLEQTSSTLLVYRHFPTENANGGENTLKNRIVCLTLKQTRAYCFLWQIVQVIFLLTQKYGIRDKRFSTQRRRLCIVLALWTLEFDTLNTDRLINLNFHYVHFLFLFKLGLD